MDENGETNHIAKSILIPFGSRSDYAILEPIIHRINFGKLLNLRPGEFFANYIAVENELKCNGYTFVFITGDRIESVAAACAAFHNRIPIIHYPAGILNKLTTLDDINRHVITLWSDIQLCESEEARDNVEMLLCAIGKTPRSYIVGTTLLDDIVLTFDQVPGQEYNLILYNPTTLFKERLNIFIGPNDDVHWINSLPREQYLGLVSEAQIFASNSSSAVYEAPWLLPKERIVHIGERNLERTKPNLEPGGAKKIKKILKRLIQEK